MKRIAIDVNDSTTLYVYVEGDCERVELGKAGEAPFHRDRKTTIGISNAATGKETLVSFRVDEIEEM